MAVKKVTLKLPQKPVTKRDKHFYDMGAEQQAKVLHTNFFQETIVKPVNDWKINKEYQDELWEQWSRKSLGDRQGPITNGKDYTWQMVSIVVFVVIILLAHPYIMSAFN